MSRPTAEEIQDMKKWIDEASYESLLRRWRFSGIGDPFFVGEVGDFFSKVMSEKKAQIGPEAAVAASKRIGWER